MSEELTVLVVGGTGRTGRRVVEQLLARGVRVRAIVRSPEKIADLAADPRLEVVEADLMSLSGEELARSVRGCDAVISCLGHVISLKGIYGKPRDLVTLATKRLCAAIRAQRPAEPVRFVLMSTVSVHQPGAADARRGGFERTALSLLRGVLPPARDNQRAADFLLDGIGRDDPHVQWVAVRPDTLLEGDVSEYEVHEGLVSTLIKPDSTAMANVAHFMCELATGREVWDEWKGKLPVIVNAGGSTGETG